MKSSTTDSFFDIAKEKSKVKIFIVTEFFKRYFPIISRAKFSSDIIYYIDLFCGPGVYDDGTKSTPVVLLDIINASHDDQMREKISMLFNDENQKYFESLKKHVQEHPAYRRLSYKPILLNQRASEGDLSGILATNTPKFSFIDPWGYVDISTNQISQLIMSIGSDCILFFNTNRILQDISKPFSETHLTSIFGNELSSVKKVAENNQLTQYEKTKQFVSFFSKNLSEKHLSASNRKQYKLFVLPFSVAHDIMKKNSHYLLFITKNHKAVREMKKVMLKKSNIHSSTTLGYDDKENYMVSFFRREDDLSQEMKSLLQGLLREKAELRKTFLMSEKWLEELDLYNMARCGVVTPFTETELKECVEQWDKEGLIDVIPLPQQKKRITYKHAFSFDISFWSE